MYTYILGKLLNLTEKKNILFLNKYLLPTTIYMPLQSTPIYKPFYFPCFKLLWNYSLHNWLSDRNTETEIKYLSNSSKPDEPRVFPSALKSVISLRLNSQIEPPVKKTMWFISSKGNSHSDNLSPEREGSEGTFFG